MRRRNGHTYHPLPNKQVAFNIQEPNAGLGVDDFRYFKQKPIDVLAHASDWMDKGMRTVFIAGAVVGAVSYLNEMVLSARGAACFGFFWNYFDALGGLLAAIDGYRRAAVASRNKEIRYALATNELFGALQLTAGTTLTVLAATGVLTGVAATVATPMSAASFSLGMVLASFREIYFLSKAIRKMDAKHLLRDRLIKCVALKAKQATLTDSHERAEIERKVNAYYSQVASIVRVEFSGIVPRDIFEHSRLKNSKDYGYEKISQWVGSASASAEDKALVKFLKIKEKRRVRQHVYGVLICVVAAVGMGLVAAGLFLPPLLFAGIALTLTAAALKAVELTEVDKRLRNIFVSNKSSIYMDNLLVNALARRQQRQVVYAEHEGKLGSIPESHNDEKLDHKTRVKLHLAYQLSKKSKLDGRYIPEEEYCSAVMNLSWLDRRRVLNGAMDKHIENKIIQSCSFRTRLSEKDQKRFVDNELRKDYRFFSTPHTLLGKAQLASTNFSVPSAGAGS